MDAYGACFTPNQVNAFMNKTLDFLETAKDRNFGYPGDDYRLVQQYSWYSMWTGAESNNVASGKVTVTP